MNYEAYARHDDMSTQHQYFKLENEDLTIPKVPKNVKLEMLVNDFALKALDRDQNGHFQKVRESVNFFPSPFSKQDSILTIYGPEEYDTAEHTEEVFSCIRRCIMEDSDIAGKVETAEQDGVYRMRFIVHPEYTNFCLESLIDNHEIKSF